VHKLDQSELQLDRSKLSYPEHLDLNTAEGSPAQNHERPTTISLDLFSLINYMTIYKIIQSSHNKSEEYSFKVV